LGKFPVLGTLGVKPQNKHVTTLKLKGFGAGLEVEGKYGLPV
jgi:hypothetical protein